MTALPPAIVIGIDTPIGLTVVRELGRHGVPVHGVGKAGSIGAASRFCRDFTVRPKSPMAEWLPPLIERTGARAVFAISETDLIELAVLPLEIAGARILTPRPEPLRRVLDKRETLALAATLGIQVPHSWQPERDENFAAETAGLSYPVVAKWADPVEAHRLLGPYGLTAEKAEFARDPAQVLALLARYTTAGHWPLIQSYCPGIGLGQMLYMYQGAATLRFQHRRLHEWPPEGGVSTWCAAEPLALHTTQMVKSEALLRALDWQGPAMVEYRFDPATGDYHLMEVNGRFWGSLPLASQCGAEFAWESYRLELLGQAPCPQPVHRPLRARYMIPETRRLLCVAFAPAKIADPAFRRTPLRDLARYLLAFFDPRTRYYVFALRDLGPSLADLRAILRKALSGGSRS